MVASIGTVFPVGEDEVGDLEGEPRLAADIFFPGVAAVTSPTTSEPAGMTTRPSSCVTSWPMRARKVSPTLLVSLASVLVSSAAR